MRRRPSCSSARRSLLFLSVSISLLFLLPFTCRVASASASCTIPKAKVDDNYCDDMVNGCDEPNTSACSLIKKTATFQCQQSVTGEPHFLFGSRVGDLICDCCDGSDEPAGTCPDICQTEREAYIAAAKEEYENVMEGKRLRDTAVVEASEIMAGWNEEIAAALALAKEQEPLLKKLRAFKAKEDKIERWEKFVWYLGERKRKQKEKEEAAAAAASPPAAEGEGEGEEGETAEGSTDTEATDIKPPSYKYKTPEPPKIKVYTDEDAPPPGGDEEESYIAKVLRAATATDGTRTLTLQEYLTGDSSSSSASSAAMPLWEGADILELNLHALGALLLGPFRALAWSVMVCKDELYLKMKWETEYQQRQRKRKFEKSTTEDGDDDANGNNKEENLVGFLINALMKGPETAVAFFRPETIENAPERLEAALLTFAVGEIEGEVEEGMRRVEELKDIMEDSVYGKEGDGRVFVTWREKEFEKQEKDHLYKIRPFEDVKQNYVLVGKWKRWIAHDDGRMTVMWFTEGQSCWNGPARSAVVQLRCGAVEEVVEVSEPSVCFYDFVMLTPLVCDDSVVQASVMKLKQLGVDVTGEEGERIAREEL